MHCPDCGVEVVPDNAKFCFDCGHSLQAIPRSGGDSVGGDKITGTIEGAKGAILGEGNQQENRYGQTVNEAQLPRGKHYSFFWGMITFSIVTGSLLLILLFLSVFLNGDRQIPKGPLAPDGTPAIEGTSVYLGTPAPMSTWTPTPNSTATADEIEALWDNAILSVQVLNLPPIKEYDQVRLTATIDWPLDSSADIDYKWNFNDGSTVLSGGPSVGHTYSRQGEYVIRVTANISEITLPKTFDINVRVEPRLSTPEITATAEAWAEEINMVVLNDSDLMVGESVNFIVMARGSEIDVPTYKWDFGDGGTAEGASANHVYEKPGLYQVQVTASREISVSGSTIVKLFGRSSSITIKSLFPTPSGANTPAVN